MPGAGDGLARRTCSSAIVHAWAEGASGNQWAMYRESAYCDSLLSTLLDPPAEDCLVRDVFNAAENGYLLCGEGTYSGGAVVRTDATGTPDWTYADSDVELKCGAWDGGGSYLVAGIASGTDLLRCCVLSDSGQRRQPLAVRDECGGGLAYRGTGGGHGRYRLRSQPGGIALGANQAGFRWQPPLGEDISSGYYILLMDACGHSQSRGCLRL